LAALPLCVIAIMVVYALILPSLLLVAKHLIATSDGQRPCSGLQRIRPGVRRYIRVSQLGCTLFDVGQSAQGDMTFLLA
jgi:hypothetical protein